MSASAASARYIITADDKTKAALASINNGFKGMERGIKSTVRSINTTLGLVAGVGLKRAFQSIFTETANSSKEFATALDDVKIAAKSLLSASDGAPAVTSAMKELAETLQDPALQKAADDLTSTLIRGFAAVVEGSAHAVIGLQALFGATSDDVENIEHRITQIDADLANKGASLPGSAGLFRQQLTSDISRLRAERDALLQQERTILDHGKTQRGTSLGFDTFIPGGLPGFTAGDLDIEGELKKQMDAFNKAENFIPGLDSAFTKRFKGLIDSVQDDINSGIVESAQQAAESIGEVGDALGDKIFGKIPQLSVYAEQAARNMQDAFADFLFDPFNDGLKGMLQSFITTIRRMVAEAAAAKIFDSIGGLGGVSGFLGGLLGGGKKSGGVGLGAFLDAFSVPKYASGTDYVPRDQLAYVHRGEKIIPAGTSSGGVGVVNNIKIDARGASPDLVSQFPALARQISEQTEARIVSRLKRGYYGGSRG